MRFILALSMSLLFMLPISASAAIFATASNKAGGEIVLTSTPCKEKPSRYIAFTRTPEGETLFACWFLEGDYVFMQYQSGEVRTYQAADFTLADEFSGDDTNTDKNGANYSERF